VPADVVGLGILPTAQATIFAKYDDETTDLIYVISSLLMMLAWELLARRNEYKCSSLALDREERRDEKKRLYHLKQDNVSDQEI
ncbi:hypothetical protein Tco_0178841, partial [Tanacetum coccineum]